MNVYVITGAYSDRSGFYLIGVYEDMREANDRVNVAKASQAALDVRVHQMPLGSVNLTDVCSTADFQANPGGQPK